MDALLTSFSWAALWSVLTGLEFWGAVTGLWCVWLCAKESVWNFPVGIVNIVIFLVMFWGAKLYASSILQLFFFALCVWGWVIWLRGTKNTKEVAVSKDMTKGEFAWALGTGSLLSLLWGKYLATTGDPAPYLDAAIAVASIYAQYFMSKKVIQSWYIWISVDVVSVYVYAHSGLYITSILYFIFLCICIKGLYEWKNEPTYQKLGVGQVPAAA